MNIQTGSMSNTELKKGFHQDGKREHSRGKEERQRNKGPRETILIS
jgi:hypothetical protein